MDHTDPTTDRMMNLLLKCRLKKLSDWIRLPGQYNYIGFAGEELREFGGHPIMSLRGSRFETLFTVFHTYQAEKGQHSLVAHPLFKRSGAAAKVRLTAQVSSKIHRDARLTSAQWWEVYHRLKLKHLQKGWEREFYNSVESHGPDKPISINGKDARADRALYAPYDAEREGTFSIEFDLEAGEYELLWIAKLLSTTIRTGITDGTKPRCTSL